VRLPFKSFQTRVARRIFLLFILSAIIPVSALALVSYLQVKGQLRSQAQMQLRQESKAVSVSLYERLWLINAELGMLASAVNSEQKGSPISFAQDPPEGLKEKFTSVSLVQDFERATSLFGVIHEPPSFTPSEKLHLQEGKALLYLFSNPDSITSVFMVLFIDKDRPEQGIIVAEIRDAYLWGIAEGLPPGIELCILNREGHVLYSSITKACATSAWPLKQITSRHSGSFEWESGDHAYFSNYRTLFLAPNFYYPELIIVGSKSEDLIFAAISTFTKAYLVIAILSLGMVFFLGYGLVQKNMEPIEILRDATQKIAGGDFSHKVEIRSGDEFEGLAASFNDMSERIQESHSLLVKAAKLSTMGQMAAGTMHEIKQPLTAISGLLQLLLLGEQAGETRKRLETAMGAVDRLNGILTRFKSFSYMSGEVMVSVSLNEALDQVLKLLEHQFAMRQIHIQIELEESLPHIAGDLQALQQVFSNLLINAYDALEGKTDGERTIKVKSHSEVSKVVVKVEDNGCGIPKEIQQTIYEPFFTTKDPEKGTGLGMAIILSILHRHQATIDLESEVGVGTRFTLIFPQPGESAKHTTIIP
jgi:signal transduction histidine kinase